jgi:uncharacterized protein (DUF1697 family)
MTKYVAFLHGVSKNQKPIRVEDLIRVFETLKFKNVKIYQNSSVIFESSEEDNDALTKTIEVALYKALNYDSGIFIKTLPEIQSLVKKITSA